MKITDCASQKDVKFINRIGIFICLRPKISWQNFHRGNSRVFEIICSYRKNTQILKCICRKLELLTKNIDILTTKRGKMKLKRYNHCCKT